MVDVKNPKCIECKQKQPRYNTPGEKKALYCSGCAKDGMVDLYAKLCEDCKKVVPIFNFPGQRKPTHCSSCKKPGMIDIAHPPCVVCKKNRPFYGTTMGKPTHCNNCKLPDHDNVVTKKCEGCNKIQAIYGLDGKATHCVSCKTNEMTDVRHTMCIVCVSTRPTYNYPGEKLPLYCLSCKEPDMVDVFNDKCLVCNLKQPSYNYPDKDVARYCVTCALPGMSSVMKDKCEVCKKVTATYNYEGETKASRCKQHKESGMIDIKHKMCITPNCNTRVQDKFRGYCVRCFIYTFPEENVSKYYRIKEKHVADCIKDTFPDLEITFNKQIDGGCSKRRPDIFIDRLTHSIIVEVDEEQHKDYDATCELARINELYTDLGDRPIVMIRFNPDAYIRNGQRIPSCFKYHKISGAPLIDDKKNWNDRLAALKNSIENYINNVPEEPLTIEYMFYNM